jgi:hypothetical protein
MSIIKQKKIRVYRDIDVRFILEEMYAKLKLFNFESHGS